MGRPEPEHVARLYRSGVDAVQDVTIGFDASAWSTPACGEWTAAETVRHLVAVVEWYDEWLDRAIAGDASPPFDPLEFAPRNRAGIERLADLGGPEAVGSFAAAATAYLARATGEWDRLFGYPGGTVTVGLHAGLAATEWHLHAWDLSNVRGPRHEPDDAAGLMVAAATAVGHAKGGLRGGLISRVAPLAAARHPWKRLLAESGRRTNGAG